MDPWINVAVALFMVFVIVSLLEAKLYHNCLQAWEDHLEAEYAIYGGAPAFEDEKTRFNQLIKSRRVKTALYVPGMVWYLYQKGELTP